MNGGAHDHSDPTFNCIKMAQGVENSEAHTLTPHPAQDLRSPYSTKECFSPLDNHLERLPFDKMK